MSNSTALMNVPVPGTNAVIPAALVDGRPFVPLKPICEVLGIQVHGQTEKLEQARWAVTQMICATGSDGKTYEMRALDAEQVPMWLATIQTNRVNARARKILETFQCEAATALRDYFYTGTAIRKDFDPRRDTGLHPSFPLAVFDRIREITEDGIEYWNGQTLARTLGISSWSKFQTRIRRAMTVAKPLGMDIDAHFGEHPLWEHRNGRPRLDYRLSYTACGLVVGRMQVDSPELTSARRYFAVEDAVDPRPAPPGISGFSAQEIVCPRPSLLPRN